MLKKSIKFTDFNGNELVEDFHFNLTEAELVEWLTTNGNYTLDKAIEEIQKKGDGKQILGMFKDLIYRSYGVKSLDGRRFIKSEEVKNEFMETEAYSNLFIELISSPEKAAEFISGISPQKFGPELTKALKDYEEGETNN